jgi:protein AFG1
MSRPSAKLCAECFPSALRAPRGLRPTTLRGAARRFYATEQKALNTRRRPSRYPLVCVSLERTRPQLAVQSPRRSLATVSDAEKSTTAPAHDGPMREYDVRVQEGRLRDDEYQRGMLWPSSAHSSRLTCAFLRDYPKSTGPL